MIFSVLFGLVLRQQTPNVSFELRGVRLETAAPTLAQALGLESLSVGPSVRNDVLLVRCKDVAPEVLKEKIAKVVNATWMHPPEGWRLAQTVEQVAQDKAVYDSERLKKFTKIVNGIQKKASQMPEFNEATCNRLQQSIVAYSKIERTEQNSEELWKRLSQIDSNSPDERLGLQIARRVTPQMFMKLTKDRPKIVFCNHPTQMQVAIPFSIDDLVNQVIREQNLWIKVAGSTPVKAKAIKSGSGDEEDVMDEGFGSLNSSREPILKENLSTVTVTLELSRENIEISTYSDKGESSLSTNVYVDDNSEQGATTFTESVSETVANDDGSKKTLPTGELKEFIDLIFQQGSRSKPKNANSPLLKKFVQPEKFDPISFIAPEAALTKIKSPNVVMVLDDTMAVPGGYDFGHESEDWERKTIVEASSDWYVSRFLNPVAIREDSVDRKVFGPIVRYLEQNQRDLTLEEDSALTFAEQWNVNPNWVFTSIKGLFQPNERGRFSSRSFSFGDDSDAAKRIYGSLTDGERRRMYNGEVAIGSLSDATRKELHRAIYFGRNGRRSGGITTDFPDEEKLTPEQERLETLVSGVFRDPTFGMPNGIQSDFTLKLGEETRPNLSVTYKVEGNSKLVEMMGDYAPRIQLDAESVGSMMFEFSKPHTPRATTTEGIDPSDYRLKIDPENIRIVLSRSMSMKLRISKWLSRSWNFEGTASNDPTVYSLKSLPQALRDEIQKGYDEAEKQYKEELKVVKEEKPPIKKVPPPRR